MRKIQTIKRQFNSSNHYYQKNQMGSISETISYLITIICLLILTPMIKPNEDSFVRYLADTNRISEEVDSLIKSEGKLSALALFEEINSFLGNENPEPRIIKKDYYFFALYSAIPNTIHMDNKVGKLSAFKRTSALQFLGFNVTYLGVWDNFYRISDKPLEDVAQITAPTKVSTEKVNIIKAEIKDESISDGFSDNDLNHNDDSTAQGNKHLTDEQKRIVEKYTAMHAFEINEDLVYKDKFKTLLGENYDSFVTNLHVTNMVVNIGKYLFGSGCMQHNCTFEQTAFAIDLDTEQVYVAILNEGSKITTYGSENNEDLPKPLLEWINDTLSENEYFSKN